MKKTVGVPLEVLGLILAQVVPSDLATITRISRTMQLEAERVLYRSVHLPAISRLKKFCRSLASPVHERSRRASHVRQLGFRSITEGSMEPDIIPLLKNTLIALQNLVILDFPLSGHYSSCFSGCRFSLQKFTTDLSFDITLSRFLRSQTEMKFISLVERPIQQLVTGILPNLETLEGTPSVVSMLAPGRPISSITIIGMMNLSIMEMVVLPALAKTNGPIQELRVILERCNATSISAIASHLPHLQRLTIDDFRPEYGGQPSVSTPSQESL